jgi:hypothetical protein
MCRYIKEIIHQKTNKRLDTARMSLTFQGVEIGQHSPDTMLSEIGVGDGSTLVGFGD